MDKKLNYLILALLAILIITKKDVICQHLGFGQAKLHDKETFSDTVKQEPETQENAPTDYLLNDSIYNWNDSLYEFIAVRRFSQLRDGGSPFVQKISSTAAEPPVKVSWQTLTHIEYVLKYYEELGTQMYAPVFPETIKKLDGKLVEVEGFVIPFEETGTEIALSANPYASCFFCGKGSPASVMSMKLAKPGKKYKMDAFLKFTGQLRLNYNDPKEFYYVLERAEEE